MGKSILQRAKVCFFCGREYGLEEHHIFGGVANRKLSDKYGLTVWLCHEHHTGKDGAQYDKEKNQSLKRLAQIAFEAKYSHAEWMEVFRKNYLKEGDMENWNIASDVIPDEGERVIVYTEYQVYGKSLSYRRGITIGEYEDGKWKCSDFIGNRVIAWMRLPELPKNI